MKFANSRFAGVTLLSFLCLCGRVEAAEPATRPATTPVHAQVQGFTYEIAARNVEARVGEPIIVTTRLTNRLQKERDTFFEFDPPLKPFGPALTCPVQVSDARGKTVPLSPYGRKLVETLAEVGSGGRRISAGEEIVNEVRIDKVFDLTAEGTYTITAKHLVRTVDGSASDVVTSNAITVRVTR